LVPRTLRYLFAALALGGLLLACGNQADARPPFSRPRPVPAYSFTVEDENGNALPTFRKNGRTYLLGESGQRYNIRVQNPTAQRVEAVVSVDGRDAVSGDPGDYVNGRGYVIPPYGSVLIEGFRRSLEQVATFRFTDPENSYSSRLGTPENVGVIGVAFFNERVPPPSPPVRRPIQRLPEPESEYQSPRFGGQGVTRENAAPPRVLHPRLSSARAAATPGLPAPKPAAKDSRPEPSRDDSPAVEESRRSHVNNLGTEFAESRESIVSSVSFERASPTHPLVITSVRYDDAEGLRARGIDLSSLGYSAWTRPRDEPEPFPASHFAEPPP